MHQLDITAWLRKNAGLDERAPVYFDDADLIYGDECVYLGALVDPKATLNKMLFKLKRHIRLEKKRMSLN